MSTKNTRPLIQETPTTFQKKYPGIQSLRIEYEKTEDRMPPEGRRGLLTESTVEPTLRCGSDRCQEGGFAIEQTIFYMVTGKLTAFEGTLHCAGHEKLGRNKKGYHCTNYLKIKATIVYHELPDNS